MALTPSSMVRATLGLASLVGSQLDALVHDDGTAPPNGSAEPNGTRLPTSAEHEDPARRSPSTDWVHLCWGALAEGGDRAMRTADALRRPIGAAVDLGSWVIDAPPLAPATKRVRATVHDLVERGRAEDAASRVAASALADRVLWRVVRSDVVDRVVIDVLHRAIGPALDDLTNRPEDLLVLVQAIVGDVIGPVLEQALPIAFDKIASQPELLGPLLEQALPLALDKIASNPELLGPLLEQALPLALQKVAAQPEDLVPVLDAVVGTALEPMMREVLPQVFAILADDPEAVRSLVRDQSTGVAAEMAGSLRVQAARADDRVDRAIRRVFRIRRTPDAVASAAPAPAVTAPIVVAPVVPAPAATDDDGPRALPPGSR